jgi:hypothetical protein
MIWHYFFFVAHSIKIHQTASSRTADLVLFSLHLLVTFYAKVGKSQIIAKKNF